MKKVIVTTTINPPTEAIVAFDAMTDYELIVIGDLKTPKDYSLKNGRYVTPEEQEKKYPLLSRMTGWNCIQRRNIGFLMALEAGADIVATVDDDNIPSAGWGENLIVGTTAAVTKWDVDGLVFDPIGVTNYPHLWHRGFPIQVVKERHYKDPRVVQEFVPIQADFWDGDPDIDAICRILFRPECRFSAEPFPFSTVKMSPFNSQNTFLHASLMPNYFMFPGIGRMDDIWGAYYLQAVTGARPVFCRASVEQQRNVHDLTRDFSLEVLGYEKTLPMLKDLAVSPDLFFTYLPGPAVAAFTEYRRLAQEIMARRQQ